MNEPAESPELREYRAEVRAWLSHNAPPRPDFLLPQSFLEVETTQQFDYLREWQQQVYAAGYLGFGFPAQYGGLGTDPARQAIVSQEMSRAGTPFMVNLIGLQWAGPTILTFGTEAQKARLIRPLLAAEEIWCQGFSEPAAGSDLASLQTRAVPDGAGGWRVTGHKVWTTLAHVSRWMILLARTNPEGNKYEGLSYFLFPMDAPGVTIEPLVKMTGEGGFNQVVFDDAPMPAESLLGELGQGWKVAITTLLFERGASDSNNRDRSEDAAMFDKVLALAKTIVRDGRAMIDDPVIRARLDDLWIDTEAVRIGGIRSGVSGLCGDHPMALPMMHKLVFSELLQKATRLACDILGPEASLWMGDANAPEGAEWPRGLMNSYGFTIGGGTSEIQRNILGERVLGLPKSK
ncbi:MAG TPA: acyl-CoA dehydrogenase family protein [Kofleriaceae bacterium]|nr:acyl-CoA dehydrogenase family protein [Kofleriaceae bacterium]